MAWDDQSIRVYPIFKIEESGSLVIRTSKVFSLPPIRFKDETGSQTCDIQVEDTSRHFSDLLQNDYQNMGKRESEIKLGHSALDAMIYWDTEFWDQKKWGSLTEQRLLLGVVETLRMAERKAVIRIHDKLSRKFSNPITLSLANQESYNMWLELLGAAGFDIGGGGDVDSDSLLALTDHGNTKSAKLSCELAGESLTTALRAFEDVMAWQTFINKEGKICCRRRPRWSTYFTAHSISDQANFFKEPEIEFDYSKIVNSAEDWYGWDGTNWAGHYDWSDATSKATYGEKKKIIKSTLVWATDVTTATDVTSDWAYFKWPPEKVTFELGLEAVAWSIKDYLTLDESVAYYPSSYSGTWPIISILYDLNNLKTKIQVLRYHL